MFFENPESRLARSDQNETRTPKPSFVGVKLYFSLWSKFFSPTRARRGHFEGRFAAALLADYKLGLSLSGWMERKVARCWWARLDSNQEPTHYECAALTD